MSFSPDACQTDIPLLDARISTVMLCCIYSVNALRLPSHCRSMVVVRPSRRSHYPTDTILSIKVCIRQRADPVRAVEHAFHDERQVLNLNSNVSDAAAAESADFEARIMIIPRIIHRTSL